VADCGTDQQQPATRGRSHYHACQIAVFRDGFFAERLEGGAEQLDARPQADFRFSA
jgi:hypothetical protein